MLEQILQSKKAFGCLATLAMILTSASMAKAEYMNGTGCNPSGQMCNKLVKILIAATNPWVIRSNIVLVDRVGYWLDTDPRWPGVYYRAERQNTCVYGGVPSGNNGYHCSIISLPNTFQSGVKYWLDTDLRWPGVYYRTEIQNQCNHGGIVDGNNGYHCALVKFRS